MAPLPKRRWSTQRQGKKRRTQRKSLLTMGKCSNCGAVVPPHSACPQCGYYRGKSIVKIKQKKEKSSENQS